MVNNARLYLVRSGEIWEFQPDLCRQCYGFFIWSHGNKRAPGIPVSSVAS